MVATMPATTNSTTSPTTIRDYIFVDHDDDTKIKNESKNFITLKII